MCGYLKIKNLTDEYPEMVTFFDREIIRELDKNINLHSSILWRESSFANSDPGSQESPDSQNYSETRIWIKPENGHNHLKILL